MIQDPANNSHQPSATNGSSPSRNGSHPAAVSEHNPHTTTSRPKSTLEQGGITIDMVRFAVGRWWRVAVPLGLLLATVAVGAIAYQYPPTYRGLSWIKIEAQKPTLVFPSSDSPLFVRTQVELVRSPLVLAPVLSKPEIARLPEVVGAPSPLEWLSKRITVQSVGGSELYQIAFDTPYSANASIVVNAVMDSYLKVQSEMGDMQTQRTVELLEQELERRAVELKRLQDNLKVVAKQVTGRDPATAREVKDGSMLAATQSPLIGMMQRLANAEVERNIMEAEQHAVQELLAQRNDSIGPEELTRAIEQSQNVLALKQELEVVRRQLKDAESFSNHGPNHPTIQRLRSLVERLETDLETAREETRKSLPEIYAQNRHAEREATVSALTGRVTTHRAMENLLREQIQREQDQLRALGDNTLELEFARADVLRAESVFEQMSERLTVIKTELRAPPRIFPLKRCTEADVRLQNNPYSKMLLAGFGMFLAPFALAVLWENRIRRVVTSEQVSDEVRLPVIAEVSTYPMRAVSTRHARNPRYDRERAMFEESVDLLRTSLTMPDQWSGLRVFTVVSAVSGEGKTSIASQLAVSLARATRERVLLIDADMRSPDIHEMFETPLTPGLAAVLDNRATLAEAVNTSWSEYVHILPAGRLHRNPHVLLTPKTMSAVLEQAREQYRYVVIDAPPLLAASESFVLAKMSDGTLLCTMRDVSRGAQVKFACERLRASGANTLGMVLSGVPSRDYAYRYGSYQYMSKTNGHRSAATSVATTNGSEPAPQS